MRVLPILFAGMVMEAALAGGPSAHSTPDWKSQKRSSVFVEMPDGVRIAVDVTLPTSYAGDGAASTRFPVIFRYTPYRRAAMDAPLGELPPGEQPDFFVARGYAMVAADMRGTGASEGWMNQMSEKIREDGKVLVDWIASQPWSNGRVGMIGGSYEGWSQLAVASTQPAALKAIMPENPGWDTFKTHPGGILSYAFMQTWSALTYHLNRGTSFPGFPILPAPPVLDEDGDGEVTDEVPLDLNGNGWFHDDYAWPLNRGAEPRYPDGLPRNRHYYLSAILQHHAHPQGAPGTYDGFQLSEMSRFRDVPRIGDGLRGADLNWAWIPQLRDSKVAILLYAGWFDAFVRSSFELQATLARSNQAQLIATPTYHQGVSPELAAAVGWSMDEDPFDMAALRWFDRWLKGIDNGVERSPALQFFVMNAGWRTATRWPLPKEARYALYLAESRLLDSRRSPVPGQDRYRADFGHQSGWEPEFDTSSIARVNERLSRPPPVHSTFLRNRQFMYGVPRALPVRTELDRKAFTYTSAPLEEDLDVIGHPIVRLWVSSTADDADLYFYLEDVHPDGEAILVTEYQHRAGFHRLRDNDTIIPLNRGIDVLPDLPWHGFDRADYDGKVFSDGHVVEVVTALYPTAWRFRKGHSIRLSIAAADWPAFELHPALSPRNRPDAPDNVVPALTFHRGKGRESRLDLPVVRN